MKLSDIFFAILYGLSFLLIIYFIFSLIKPGQSTVIIYQDDQPPVYQESSIWPWYGGYNWYNSWSPWSYTGSGYYNRGYGGSHGPRWGSGQTRPWGGGGHGAHAGGHGAHAGGRGGH